MESLKELTSDVNNFPELKNVIDNITQIFEFIATDEMIELKQRDKM